MVGWLAGWAAGASTVGVHVYRSENATAWRGSCALITTPSLSYFMIKLLFIVLICKRKEKDMASFNHLHDYCSKVLNFNWNLSCCIHSNPTQTRWSIHFLYWRKLIADNGNLYKLLLLVEVSQQSQESSRRCICVCLRGKHGTMFKRQSLVCAANQ